MQHDPTWFDNSMLNVYFSGSRDTSRKIYDDIHFDHSIRLRPHKIVDGPVFELTNSGNLFRSDITSNLKQRIKDSIVVNREYSVDVESLCVPLKKHGARALIQALPGAQPPPKDPRPIPVLYLSQSTCDAMIKYVKGSEKDARVCFVTPENVETAEQKLSRELANELQAAIADVKMVRKSLSKADAATFDLRLEGIQNTIENVGAKVDNLITSVDSLQASKKVSDPYAPQLITSQEHEMLRVYFQNLFDFLFICCTFHFVLKELSSKVDVNGCPQVFTQEFHDCVGELHSFLKSYYGALALTDSKKFYDVCPKAEKLKLLGTQSLVRRWIFLYKKCFTLEKTDYHGDMGVLCISAKDVVFPKGDQRYINIGKFESDIRELSRYLSDPQNGVNGQPPFVFFEPIFDRTTIANDRFYEFCPHARVSEILSQQGRLLWMNRQPFDRMFDIDTANQIIRAAGSGRKMSKDAAPFVPYQQPVNDIPYQPQVKEGIT